MKGGESEIRLEVWPRSGRPSGFPSKKQQKAWKSTSTALWARENQVSFGLLGPFPLSSPFGAWSEPPLPALRNPPEKRLFVNEEPKPTR